MRKMGLFFLCLTCTSILMGMTRGGVSVEVGRDDGYYYDDDRYYYRDGWYGPGWYWGVYFNDRDAYYAWNRRYHHYPHHWNDGRHHHRH